MIKLITTIAVFFAAIAMAGPVREQIIDCDDNSRCVFSALITRAANLSDSPKKYRELKQQMREECHRDEPSCMGEYVLTAFNKVTKEIKNRQPKPREPDPDHGDQDTPDDRDDRRIRAQHATHERVSYSPGSTGSTTEKGFTYLYRRIDNSRLRHGSVYYGSRIQLLDKTVYADSNGIKYLYVKLLSCIGCSIISAKDGDKGLMYKSSTSFNN